MSDPPLLFEDKDIPKLAVIRERNFKSLQYPLWSEQKSHLIQQYLKLFTFVTKHGNYIDGFSAPQRRDITEICSAKLVLENEPKWLRDFWLCDIDPKSIALLDALGDIHRDRNRRVEIVKGDFNEKIHDILKSNRITTKTATFALLDQRTFECHWKTVETIARHKPSLGDSHTKIEIFYFLASGWLDRSIAAVRRPSTAVKLDRWWGHAGWRSLSGMQGIMRANLLANRFKNELGYKYAHPYAIHNKKRNGRTMYHMIHATDHDEAPILMLRAYRKISGRKDLDLATRQVDMSELWAEVQVGARGS